MHYFLSSSATIPHTSSLRANPWHAPTLKKVQGDAPRTAPLSLYQSDGSGRDSFKGNSHVAPRTGKQFSVHIAPAPDGRTGLGYKGFHYPFGIRSGYAPNGTGRDLQVFHDSPEVSNLPRTGFQYAEKAPHIKRYEQPLVASRTEGPTRCFANGTGRDMYLLAVGSNVRAKKIPATATMFSAVPPSPKKVPAHGLRPVAKSTSPPPKYVASGSGRDTFQTSIQANDGWNHPTDRMGFGPPSWDPALLGRPRTSASEVLNQRQRMSSLSRPRSSRSSGYGSPGLLAPGKNFRQ